MRAGFDAASIVVNGRFLTQPITGVQRFALEITRALARRVPLVVVTPPGERRIADVAGARVVRIGRSAGHVWEQVDLPWALARAGHPLLLNLASTGPVAARNQVTTHHDITYVRHPESFARSFRLLYGAIVPPLLRRSRAIVTVSEFSRGEIAAHFGLDPRRIDVVPNAVSPPFGADGERHVADEPYLLAVSSPNLHKNFARLVEAFLQTDTTTIAKLFIVGGQARAFAASDVSSDDRIVYLGRVDDDRLAALYRGATAFAFPSLYEGFGIPPLEAQLAGTAVIASDAASIPEVLRESALYFDPLDVRSIRAAIERIDADAAIRAELAASGRANAARFSWDRSAAMIEEIIHRVRGELPGGAGASSAAAKVWMP